MLFFGTPYTRVMYGIRQCNRKKISGEIGAFFTEIFFKFQLWYWIKNFHYQIFKFVIDNSDISLNCLQHIQKRRNFDAKVTCHQPICLLLHAILSGVGVSKTPIPRFRTTCHNFRIQKPHSCVAHRAQSMHCTARNTQSAWIEPPMK